MDADYKNLRWRCRRGMLELDVMLTRFLDRHFQQLPESQQAIFVSLLDQEDDMLWDWMSGRQQPQEPGWLEIVDQIRNNN